MGDEEQQQQEESQDSGAESARQQAQEVEEAKEEIHRLEEGDPPEKLEDWPTGRAKYLTYGGPEGTAGYDEGPTAKLGPSSLEHHEDGSVSIEGEKVDNPEEYKADEPVPGAPQRAREDDGSDEDEASQDDDASQDDEASQDHDASQDDDSSQEDDASQDDDSSEDD